MRKNLFYMSLLASMAFAFTACSDGDKDDEKSLGNENEACMEGNVCNGDLICQNDVCVKQSGVADGAEGGKCLADNKCNGELVCENDVCKAKSGAADGAEGGKCLADNKCNGELVCENNVCKAKSGAADGAEGGKCLADNKCNGELVCENDVCKAKSGAADGAEGGKCLADNKCNGELVCENDVCKAKSGPADGAEGGKCKADGSCDKYLACDANVCKPVDNGKLGGKCSDEIKCDTYLNCNVDVCEAIADGAEGGKCKADGLCDGDLLCKADVCVVPGPGDKDQVCREDGYCNGNLVCNADDSGEAKCVEAAGIVEELVKSEELIEKVQTCLFNEPVPVPSAGEEGGDDNAQAKNLMEKLNGVLVDENVVCGNYLNQPILDILNDLATVDKNSCLTDDGIQLGTLMGSAMYPSLDYYACMSQSGLDLDEKFDTLLETYCGRAAMDESEEKMCVEELGASIDMMRISEDAVCASQFNEAFASNILKEPSASIYYGMLMEQCNNNVQNNNVACVEACGSNEECTNKCNSTFSTEMEMCAMEVNIDMYNKFGYYGSANSVPREYILCLHESEAEMSKKAQSWAEIQCRVNDNFGDGSLDSCVKGYLENDIYTGISIDDDAICASEYKDSIAWKNIMMTLGAQALTAIAMDSFSQWWKDNAESASFEEKMSAAQSFMGKGVQNMMMDWMNEADSKYQDCLNAYPDRVAVASYVLDQLCGSYSYTVAHELMFSLTTECSEDEIKSFIPKADSVCYDQMMSYIINVFPALIDYSYSNRMNLFKTEEYSNMLACVDDAVKPLLGEKYDNVKQTYSEFADMTLKELSASSGMTFDTEAADYALFFMYENVLYKTFLLLNRYEDDSYAKAYLDCGIAYGECYVAAKDESDKYKCEDDLGMCAGEVRGLISAGTSSSASID